jgi:HEAT repeat protein
MGKSAAPATPYLIEALALKGVVSFGFGGSSNAPQAAWALSSIGPSTVPLLLAALDSPNPQVRGLAAEALGHIGAPAADAATRLLSLLGDQKKYDLVNGCMGRSPTVSESAVVALGRLGPPAKTAVPRLLAMLRQTATGEADAFLQEYDRQFLVEALLRIAPREPSVQAGLTELLDELQSEDPSAAARLKLAVLQLDFDSPQSIDHMRDLLSLFQGEEARFLYQYEFVVLCEAIVRLGSKGKEFHRQLRSLMCLDPLVDPDHRCTAAAALLRIDSDDRQARVHLERAARSMDYSVQNAAKEAWTWLRTSPHP